MRLILTVLICSLTVPAAAGAQTVRDQRLAPPADTEPATPAAWRARGDALRARGDYTGALAAYEAERRTGGDSADVWKHIGWTERALRQFASAARALQHAVDLDPKDQEAREDLESLKVAHGLALQMWTGGTEPGTSKNAYEGQARFSGLNRVELEAGASRTDNIFYESTKGYGSAYFFYSPDSYIKANITMRQYRYSGASRPTPDSSAYDLVPRGEIELSSQLSPRIQADVDYQIFLPNFFFDPATRITNHKVSTEITGRLGGGFSATILGAVLRDPDPDLTSIAGRPSPVVPGTIATATSAVFRTELLVGGGAAYEGRGWGAGVKFIPNRDLDSSYQWSAISSVSVQPVRRLALDLQWVRDRYSNDAGPAFAGKNGNIWWGTSRYEISNTLAVTGGLKWVTNPGPKTTTTSSVNGVPVQTRNDPTVLVSIEYRTRVF